MLTKQERTAIAERANKFTYRYSSIYEVLLGHTAPDNTAAEDDCIDMVARIIDLCDTSNMIELPLDKDGEVIHVGDTLYYGSSSVYKVKKIIYKGNKWEIQFFDEKLCISVYDDPDTFTHKKPVTIASLNEQLRHVLDKGHMSAWSMAELFDIADKLESLGDSDD